MKKSILLILTIALVTLTALPTKSFAQRKSRQYSPPYKNILVSAGVVPDSEFKAFKGMAMINNVVLKRLGAYVSYENGIDDYQATILGATFGINKYAFIYAGFGLDKSIDGSRYSDGKARKEAGIGFTPYKFTAATIGWSKGVGMTYTIGINIPLFDSRDTKYTAYR